MLPTLNCKYVQITSPAALVDNAAFTTNTIDTQGYDYLTVLVSVGATDIAFAGLKMQESNDSGMSGAADITGLVFGTSTNTAGSTSAVPSATDDNKLFAFHVDLKACKRYLDVVATGGDGSTGAYMACIGILSRAAQTPTTATGRGFDEELIA